MIVQHETVELDGMRTHVVRPVAAGRYPGVIFFSEIFQITEPIRRMAAFFAGHGYVVAMPEVFHEFAEPGEVFPYDQAGADRGNALKRKKTLASYDADARKVIDHLGSRADCTGKIGALGVCLGGHLAFRAATFPEVAATACFYATDLHAPTLGPDPEASTLALADQIRGELLLVWGRQDPHVPLAGRRIVRERLDALELPCTWLEVNGAHAFLRDEGPRYDPELSHSLLGAVLGLWHRCLS
jgi:carboxymethylenebutenolidase